MPSLLRKRGIKCASFLTMLLQNYPMWSFMFQIFSLGTVINFTLDKFLHNNLSNMSY